MNRKVIAILVTGVLLVAACGGQVDDTGVLKIAVIAPFSDEFASLGQSSSNGAIIAVEEWNQRGGVLGQTAQVILLDSRCDYTVAREVAQQAVDEHGVQFIIGAVCGNASEGVAQVAMTNGVLAISPTSVDPETTLDAEGAVRWLVFRVPFIDPVQGTVAANFALQELDAESAAILYAEESDYGLSLADAFEEAFTAGDGEVLLRATYNQNDELFYDVLEDVRTTDPDVIYAPGYYNVINPLVSQARAFGLFQTFIGSDGWDSPDLDLQETDGSYFTTHYFAGEPRIEVVDWIQRYTSRYLVPPDTIATLSYDAANILLAAIQEAETTVPVDVADTMMQMTFDTISGEITFDETHDPVKSVLMLRVRGGMMTYVDRLMP